MGVRHGRRCLWRAGLHGSDQRVVVRSEGSVNAMVVATPPGGESEHQVVGMAQPATDLQVVRRSAIRSHGKGKAGTCEPVGAFAAAADPGVEVAAHDLLSRCMEQRVMVVSAMVTSAATATRRWRSKGSSMARRDDKGTFARMAAGRQVVPQGANRPANVMSALHRKIGALGARRHTEGPAQDSGSRFHVPCQRSSPAGVAFPRPLLRPTGKTPRGLPTNST